MEEQIRNAQRKVHHINVLYHRVLAPRLEKTGVYRGQHRILMFLSFQEGKIITQNRIAEALDISSAAVAVSLKKLEKGGYIQRHPEAEDSRFNQVSLTKKGEQVVHDSRAIFRQADSQMYQHITEEQMTVFMSLLEQIEGNLCEALKESESDA